MTDADILAYVVALYAYPGISSVSWDHFDNGLLDDGICWAAKEVNGVFVVICRGSVTLHDFEADASALLTLDQDLGAVHSGMFRGMRKQWAEVLQVIGDKPWIVAGHSLGASRTCLLAGLGRSAGRAPLRYVRFGEPRPGCQKLADVLADVPGASYRTIGIDGHDTVTDVPFHFAPLWPYMHPQPLIDIPAIAEASDPWGPWRYHHIQLYQASIGA